MAIIDDLYPRFGQYIVRKDDQVVSETSCGGNQDRFGSGIECCTSKFSRQSMIGVRVQIVCCDPQQVGLSRVKNIVKPESQSAKPVVVKCWKHIRRDVTHQLGECSLRRQGKVQRRPYLICREEVDAAMVPAGDFQ